MILISQKQTGNKHFGSPPQRRQKLHALRMRNREVHQRNHKQFAEIHQGLLEEVSQNTFGEGRGVEKNKIRKSRGRNQEKAMGMDWAYYEKARNEQNMLSIRMELTG
ncbi:hypothetical protein PoB_000281800 [Plakobranchus ocellatus]|uniref:Uncharacterized protein n=1 Tax=Plakobranchus ocellatus TaxID=259542 RepID=A0AAV3Y250_9GAST|nr:hypothetical protein PoB_000281800 [Plakobranchus ocellatus]